MLSQRYWLRSHDGYWREPLHHFPGYHLCIICEILHENMRYCMSFSVVHGYQTVKYISMKVTLYSTVGLYTVIQKK